METSCSFQQPHGASALLWLRTGDCLHVESCSTGVLCRFLEGLDDAFVDTWRFEDAQLGGYAARRPHAILLVCTNDWERSVNKARSLHGDLPIIAAGAGPAQEPLALHGGADVFCTLPLDWPVFNARVRAVLRREAQRRNSRPPSSAAPLQLEAVGRVLYATGTPITLSPREYDLILALYERAEQWVPRQILLKAMGINHKGYDSSLLRMHVLNIRNKLGRKHWMLQSDRTRGFLLTVNPKP